MMARFYPFSQIGSIRASVVGFGYGALIRNHGFFTETHSSLRTSSSTQSNGSSGQGRGIYGRRIGDHRDWLRHLSIGEKARSRSIVIVWERGNGPFVAAQSLRDRVEPKRQFRFISRSKLFSAWGTCSARECLNYTATKFTYIAQIAINPRSRP